ncbi:TPA: hypothetical protein ACJJDV_000209 [Neisseria meningitidis]
MPHPTGRLRTLKARCRLKRSAAAFSPPTRPLFVIPAQAGIPKPLPPSFPRRRESSPFGFSRFR